MSKRGTQKQAARVVRDQLAKEQRRRKTLWTAVAAVGVLVIAGLIGWGIYAAQKPDSYNTPKHASGGDTGIVAGADGPTVDIYLDFLCPHCKTFEQEAGPVLKKLANEGKATVVYHPVAFLDRYSTNQYSTRSAASSGCAADADKFVEYADALFAKQPAEGGPGPTDDDLVQIGGSVGLINPSFAQCVRDGKYLTWVNHVNEGASKRKVNGTPTVFVDGKLIDAPTGAKISAAVEASAK